MGTDYPFDMGMYKPRQFVNGARLAACVRKARPGGNAARQLKAKK